MRKPLMVCSGVILAVVAALTFAAPYIKMELAGSAHYSEQDKREYDFYTPELLKKMPRIVPKYTFDFANIAGPATHVYAVKFYGTTDILTIEDYLSKMGYKQETCDFDAVCWRGADPQESVYVDAPRGENTVIVQVVYNLT